VPERMKVVHSDLIDMITREISDESASDMLRRVVYKQMTMRLNEKREEGEGGWLRQDPAIDPALYRRLRDNVGTGDWIDVINLAAMLMVRKELYGGG